MLTVDAATAASQRCYPSVSLLVQLRHGWEARLAALGREAAARLTGELGDDADRIRTRLDEAIRSVAAPPGARSLALYVNDTASGTRGLDVDVRERVIIDDTFATRDLVAGELRSPRCWVLALSLDEPRLLRLRGRRLEPVELELRDTFEHPASRRGQRGRDRSDVVDARRTRRLRAVDQALGEALRDDDDPVIVVGAEPTLGRFLRMTHHIRRVEGIVRRAPDRRLDALARTVAPAVDAVLADRRIAALATLNRATGAGTAASGIEPVWREAHRQTGLLLVEEDYEQPARVLAGVGLVPVEDPTEPGVIDDAVDEIIEAVLARHGRVELVAPGSLSTHDRIAFAPRARSGPRSR